MQGTLAAFAVALLTAAGAGAAIPTQGETYQVHDHNTPGDNWHVQVDVHETKRRVSVIVHSDRCGGNTPFATAVPYDADGVAKTYRALDPEKPGKGYWTFESRFTESHRLDGTFRIVTRDCDTGPMVFVAHAGAHTHISYGTPMGAKPDMSLAKPRRLAQAQALYEESWRRAKRFWNIEDAYARGFFDSPSDDATRRAHVYHLRHLPFTQDKIYFNPKKTESLMYYNGLEGPPVLIGYMFRYKLKGGHPPFARPLLGWHAHGKGVWRGIPNQMTHVWLTNDLRSALSNCMPVEELEAALPDFEFSPMQPDVIQEARPCPAE